MDNILLALLLFLLIWLASSGVISGITKLSLKAKLPTFLVSFVLLGILTSLTEISLAINSHINKTPEISVGNLLGGIIVIFLLIIPILAVFGNGVSTKNNYSRSELLITLLIVCLPSIFFLDEKLSDIESKLLIMGYIFPILLLIYKHKNSPIKKVRIPKNIKNLKTTNELLKIIIAGATLLFASDQLIQVVVNSSLELNISPFIISLLTLSIGTNLPELVIVIRSVISGQKDIALGNYIGSALMNLAILGSLSLLNPNMPIPNGFIKIFIFTIIGLILFYIFINTKKTLSRREGLALLMLYILFVLSEMFIV